MPKFSFVVPVYKSEKYLNDCVDSILRQDYKDFEIILVDDESPDSSPIICDELASCHETIRTIHQKNGGASVARNTGFDFTAGQYVIFLDSDDYWLDASGLSKIDKLLNEEVDIVIFASKDYYEKDKTFIDDRYDYPMILNSLNNLDCLYYMIEHDLFNLHASKRVYKKEFLQKNNLYFKPGIRTEDVELGLRAANCLPTYRFLNEKLYVYRHHEDSVTTSIGTRHLREFADLVFEAAKAEYNPQIKEHILSYIAYQYALMLAHVTSYKIEGKKEILNESKNYQYLFRYRKYPRTKLISDFHRIFGFDLTRFALSIYLKRGL